MFSSTHCMASSLSALEYHDSRCHIRGVLNDGIIPAFMQTLLPESSLISTSNRKFAIVQLCHPSLASIHIRPKTTKPLKQLSSHTKNYRTTSRTRCISPRPSPSSRSCRWRWRPSAHSPRLWTGPSTTPTPTTRASRSAARPGPPATCRGASRPATRSSRRASATRWGARSG